MGRTMVRALVKKMKVIAFIFVSFVHLHPYAHADELLREKIDEKSFPNIANSFLPKKNRNPELNLFINLKNAKTKAFEINYLSSSFNKDRTRFYQKLEPKKVSFGTVFKLALDEFDFLSGVKKVVNVTSGKIDNYKKQFYLTGRVVFEKKKKYEPRNFIQKLKLKKIKWNFDIDPDEKEISGRFEFGKNFALTGSFGEVNEFATMVSFDF